MTYDALFIGGSPSTTSRSSALLDHLARQLDRTTKSFGPRDFPAEDLRPKVEEAVRGLRAGLG